MSGRYAEGTAVDVEKSRAEMIGTLGRYAVRKFGWDQDPVEGDALFFELGGKAYRMMVRKPKAADFEYNPRIPTATLVEREWRRRWRAVAMLLKMKLEFADSGDSTIENELMAYMVLQDGSTLGEAIAGNKVPLLAATTGGK